MEGAATAPPSSPHPCTGVRSLNLPLNIPKSLLDTSSIGLQVPGGSGGGDAEHRAGTGRGQCPLLGMQGPNGNSEQNQSSPRLFHLPVWPLGHLVLLILAFFKTNSCLNSPRAPTKAAGTSSVPGQSCLVARPSLSPWRGQLQPLLVSPCPGAGGSRSRSRAHALPQVPDSSTEQELCNAQTPQPQLPSGRPRSPTAAPPLSTTG